MPYRLRSSSYIYSFIEVEEKINTVKFQFPPILGLTMKGPANFSLQRSPLNFKMLLNFPSHLNFDRKTLMTTSWGYEITK